MFIFLYIHYVYKINQETNAAKVSEEFMSTLDRNLKCYIAISIIEAVRIITPQWQILLVVQNTRYDRKAKESECCRNVCNSEMSKELTRRQRLIGIRKVFYKPE